MVGYDYAQHELEGSVECVSVCAFNCGVKQMLGQEDSLIEVPKCAAEGEVGVIEEQHKRR